MQARVCLRRWTEIAFCNIRTCKNSGLIPEMSLPMKTEGGRRLYGGRPLRLIAKVNPIAGDLLRELPFTRRSSLNIAAGQALLPGQDA